MSLNFLLLFQKYESIEYERIDSSNLNFSPEIVSSDLIFFSISIEIEALSLLI